jgi:hypothetical protein
MHYPDTLRAALWVILAVMIVWSVASTVLASRPCATIHHHGAKRWEFRPECPAGEAHAVS